MSDETEATKPVYPDQEAVQKEMAYTDLHGSCKDVHVTPTGELRECRRAKRHTPPHASGYGTRHEQWYDKP